MTSDDTPTERDEPAGQADEWIRSEWNGAERPSTAVIEAIASATDRDPLRMPPLYDHVATDALDALVATEAIDTTSPVNVSFAYDGLEIRVDSDGEIRIRGNTTDPG